MTTKPSFEEFLRMNTLVQEKYVSYYVYWVNGFRYACKNDVRQLTYDNLARFLNGLEDKRDEWKVRQAADGTLDSGRLRPVTSRSGNDDLPQKRPVYHPLVSSGYRLNLSLCVSVLLSENPIILMAQ